MKPEDSLLIIGASARHVAQSANSAGLYPLAIDLFGDWDLRKIADCTQVKSLSRLDVEASSSRFEPGQQFLICGGMETRTDVVTQLASKFSFLGPQPSQLSRIQNPFLLSDICRANSIAFPPVRRFDNISKIDEVDCKWLVKPLLGTGGHAISHWANDSKNQSISENQFLQKQIHGASYSALFACDDCSTALLGITQQLIGPPFSDKPFAYCGSVGPVQLNETIEQELARAGDCIAEAFRLVGCFGIDFVVDANDLPWLIEINPRIPASAEVFELAGCFGSIVSVHLRSCTGGPSAPPATARTLAGKAIVYSDFATILEIDDSIFDFLKSKSLCNATFADSDAAQFSIADIPQPGTKILPGHPIVSIFVAGQTVETAIGQLIDAARKTRDSIKKLADFAPASS